MSKLTLTDEQRAILDYCRRCPRQGGFGGVNGYLKARAFHGAPHANRPALWGALVRKGLLESAKFDAHPLGGERYSETRYKITDAGLSALANTQGGNP